MVVRQTCFLNGIKPTDRGWDWTYDLVPISTKFGPLELKLMTISLSHLRPTQHLNWGSYFSFSLGLPSKDISECLIPEPSLKDSQKTGASIFPILVQLPTIIYIA
jgi:hypothetical protein